MKLQSHYLLYISRFFGDFIPIVPYMTLFFIAGGFSTQQVLLLLATWSFAVIVSEIPAGMVADSFDRKKILIISKIFKLLCFIIWILFLNWWGIITGFIFWGIGTALESGTMQAYIYSLLEKENKGKDFQKIYGRTSSASFLGLFLAATLSTFLIDYGYNTLIFFGLGSLLISITALLFLPKDRPELEKETSTWTWDRLWDAISPAGMLVALTIGITAGGIKGSLEELYPLLLDEKWIPLALIGLVIAGFEIVKTIGSLFVSWLKPNLFNQIILFTVTGFFMTFTSLAVGYYVIVCLVIITYLDVLLWVLNDIWIQENTKKDKATAASVKNFGVEIISFVTFLFSGLLGAYQVGSLFLVGGGIVVFIGIILFLIIGLKIKKGVVLDEKGCGGW